MPSTTYTTNDLVYHPSFGNGTVLEAQDFDGGDILALVQWDKTPNGDNRLNPGWMLSGDLKPIRNDPWVSMWKWDCKPYSSHWANCRTVEVAIDVPAHLAADFIPKLTAFLQTFSQPAAATITPAEETAP